ncbi:PKD-like family lipoprotein [Flavisolibacter tropicus]|uniref:PKD-like family protein n=1 Tax=Flavisolibacter tropicus TaxID=1492898 RepID=A0A172U1G2_9BACT|nr:PKD-like family lipoprotein [Flavisolibacter tropicus]ANE53191.1 hypothetical protein SY85_24725 [Flavisolibacter tropicus]
MKKHFIPASISVLILFAFVACKKDLGNYKYTDVNTITITTDMANVDPQVVVTNDSIVLRQNDSLKLDILLSQTQQSDDLSYQWLITQSSSSEVNPAQYILGNEKQLRTKITVPPNIYRLVLKVTDKKTGVSFYKYYSINVDTSPWGGEGWLVLQEQPTQAGCDLSIITDRDGKGNGTVYNNLYFQANGHKLPLGTYKTAVLNYSSTLRIQKVSFFYPNGGTQVRSLDYLDSSNHNGWFYLPPSVVNIKENNVFPATGQYEYVINNGQIHFQQVNATSIKTPPIKLSVPFLGTWSELHPSVLMGNADGTFTVFDKVNRCFFTIWNNSGTPTLVPSARADTANRHYAPYPAASAANLLPTGKGFDLNNMRHNLVYAENVSPMTTTPIYYDCIFRNTPGDSTFLYQFPGANSGAGGGYANNFATGRFYLSESKVPGITTASIFAMPTFLTILATTYGVFYYVHGTNKNSIYVCSPSYTGTMPATTTSSLGHSFPVGTIIKAMKVFKSGYSATGLPSTESKVLVVATDETAIGNGNNVYFFNLTNAGGIITTPFKVYSGFDNIVDITFKKGLGL